MQEKPIELAEGSAAPDFAMRDKQGKENKLSDLHGKRDVVVYFYPEDFTPGCTTQATEFSRDYKKFKAAAIKFLVIPPENEKPQKIFGKNINPPYPLFVKKKN